MGRTVSGSETEHGMSDETTSKAGKTWLLYLSRIVLLPLCYLFSVGPAVVLVERSAISRGAFESTYAPVIWLVEVTGTSSAADAYVRLWLSLTGTSHP